MKTQSMFALSIVPEEGFVGFHGCKANFLFSLELEYFSFKWSNHCSPVRVCDGRETTLGRVRVWDVVGSFAWGHILPPPWRGSALWNKVLGDAWAAPCLGNTTRQSSIWAVRSRRRSCPLMSRLQPVTERDCQGHMLIFQSFGQVTSHIPQDPGACVYWIKISAQP